MFQDTTEAGPKYDRPFEVQMATGQRVKSLDKFVARTTIDQIPGVTFRIDIHVSQEILM